MSSIITISITDAITGDRTIWRRVETMLPLMTAPVGMDRAIATMAVGSDAMVGAVGSGGLEGTGAFAGEDIELCASWMDMAGALVGVGKHSIFILYKLKRA